VNGGRPSIGRWFLLPVVLAAAAGVWLAIQLYQALAAG
jgi:hypothetical protein